MKTVCNETNETIVKKTVYTNNDLCYQEFYKESANVLKPFLFIKNMFIIKYLLFCIVFYSVSQKKISINFQI